MIGCVRNKKLFVRALYNELNDKEKTQLDNHLKECKKCSQKFSEMSSTLTIMNKRKLQEPAQQFWNGYWEKLTEKYPEFSERKKKRFAVKFKEIFPLRYPAFVRVAAAVSLIAVGIIIGKYLFTPEEKLSQIETADSFPSSLVIQKANDYLETSTIILVGIINSNGELRTRDFSLESQASAKLLEDARFIKANLGDTEQERRLKELVEELESILFEIANLTEKKDSEYVKLLTEGINEKGILFKIRIYEMTKNKIEEIKYES